MAKRQTVMPPDEMMPATLKQFFTRTVWSEDQRRRFHPLVETVQHRRNAIHSYKDRDIGDLRELRRCIREYLDFLHEMHGQSAMLD